MILTRSRLAEIGEALYGESWPGVLAAKLNRSRETVARWANGRYDLPAKLRDQILDALDDQERAIREARASLMSHSPQSRV
jgi:hypothetical protein